MSSKPKKPTLADIISGKVNMEKAAKTESVERAVSQVTVSSTGISSPNLNGLKTCEKTNEMSLANRHSMKGGVNKMKSTKDHSVVVFAEAYGVTRDNIRQLLDRMGIQNIPTKETLDLYFTDPVTGCSRDVMPPEQWIALVELLVNDRSEKKSNALVLPNENSFDTHILRQHRKEEVLQQQSQQEQERRQWNQEPGEQHDGASIFTGDDSNIKRNDRNTKNSTLLNILSLCGRERWVTGNEEGDMVLSKLFIYCGALSSLGADKILLYPRGFKRMTDIRKDSLPPYHIVTHAGNKLGFREPVDAEYSINLRHFYSIIQEELKGLESNRKWDLNARSLPTLCMILSSIGPECLRRVCDNQTVEYLSSEEIVIYVLDALGYSKNGRIQRRPHLTNTNSYVSKSETECLESCTQRPSAALRPEKLSSNHQLRRQIETPLHFESHPSRMPSCPTATPSNEKCRRRSYQVFEVPPSHTHTSTDLLDTDRVSSTPRYMEPRPLDEISASIIARAKARKLIDRLRQNTIPANRLECFARIEYIQKGIFDEVNLSDDDDDESEENKTTTDAGTLAQTHGKSRSYRPSFKVRSAGVSGPLLPGMYKMGGFGHPVSRKAHQETFERLYRSSFDSYTACRSSSRGGVSSASQYPSENGMHSTAPSWTSSHPNASTLPPRRGTPVKRQEGNKVPNRPQSRPTHMLADVFVTRYAPYTMVSESSYDASYPYSSKDINSTSAVDSPNYFLHRTKPPIPKRRNSDTVTTSRNGTFTRRNSAQIRR